MRLWRIRPACVGYRCAKRRRCLVIMVIVKRAAVGYNFEAPQGSGFWK